MIHNAIPRNRFEDIRRTIVLSSSLLCLDEKTYLFREAYSIGFPKFTDVDEVRPGQRMTAFVGIDAKGEFLFCWGRQFFDELLDDTLYPLQGTSLDRVMFVLAHETLHVVLCHVTRAGGKVAKIWNWAADIVVNHFCDWYGLRVLDGACVADNFPAEWGIDPTNQTTEQIYEILLRQADAVPEFGPGNGNHDQWADLDEKTRDILEGQVIEANNKASIKDEEEGKNDPDDDDAKGCGKLPGESAMGEVRKLADRIIADNSVPWDKMLRQRIGSMYQPHVAERWDRLPTRLLGLSGRVILPSFRMDRKRNGLHILTAIDASCSMSDEDVERMRSIHASLPDIYTVTMASFDTECYLIKSLDAIQGGGGTRLDDVNRVAMELEVDCVICLTDGYFRCSGLDKPEDWVFIIDGTDRHVPSESTVFNV